MEQMEQKEEGRTVRELTCITCPMGCSLRVTLEHGEFSKVEGNRCKRGAEYAYAEITHPVRTLTTTMAVKGHPELVIPVKSDRPIPKGSLFDAMKRINQEAAELPVHMGEVLISDLYGADIEATAPMDLPVEG